MTGANPQCTPLARELAPFADALREPEFARTASDTLRWLFRNSGVNARAERRLPALVTAASVYARLCAPSGASERSYDTVARFTLLFFLVDDAALAELPDLLAESGEWSIGRYTSALRTWLAEFPELALASPRLRERFAHAYHDYLAARKAEHGHKAQPLSVAEHWAFRRRSIFMDPYLDLWMILCGIDLDRLAEAEFGEARALAVDLVLLANDLGSAERDRQGGASPDDLNLIHTYAREHDETEAAALKRLIGLHNLLVEQYRTAILHAIAILPGPHAERYADLLTGVVEGNVASVRALGFRYPGAEAVLNRLASVRPA